MTDTIATLGDMTPIGAVLVLAATLQVVLTQLAKHASWSARKTQAVAAGLALVLGLAAALVLGLIAGVPESITQAVSSVILSVAAVAVLGRAIYATLGHVLPSADDPAAPDEDEPETPPDGPAETVVPARGRRACRHGQLGGRDTPPDA